MSFPAPPPFNPQVSKTRILGPSSGNPKSFQDPNSVATVGSKIQAMADQAKADTLYDPPVPIPEGFRNEIYNPWILGTEVCKKEGFETYTPWILGTEACKREGFMSNRTSQNGANISIVVVGLLGVIAVLMSFMKR